MPAGLHVCWQVGQFILGVSSVGVRACRVIAPKLPGQAPKQKEATPARGGYLFLRGLANYGLAFVCFIKFAFYRQFYITGGPIGNF